MSLEAIGIKRFKRFDVQTVQFDSIALECFTNMKNISIYRIFGCNRPMKRINGSDETYDRKSSQLSPTSLDHDRTLEMKPGRRTL